MVSGIKSAELKLARAAKHLRAVKRCVAIYSASRPHKVIKKAGGKRKLNIPKPPPREISILAGEMVYQMRSALDHLAFDIIKLNRSVATMDPKWPEHCQFPLRMKTPHGCAPPVTKNEFSRELPGISDKAFAIIEGMQPYYGSNAVSNCLRFLAHLSNIDKHRHLNLIHARVRKTEKIRYRSGMQTGGFQALDRGAIIDPSQARDESDPPVHVKRSYRAFVAFNERDHLGDATTYPIDILLSIILYHINAFIVPTLHKLIRNP
jgi:hypothetical protein